jgi:O-antigen/teichoic acid export membrane protein
MSSSQTSQRILANTFWVGLDQALGIVGGVIASILVARVLGPVKLGYYSYVFWMVTTASLVGNLGIPRATRKYLSELLARNETALAKTVFRLTFRMQATLASVLVGVGLAVVAFTVPPVHRVFALLAVLCMGPSMTMVMLTAANTAVEDLAANVWPSLIGTAVNLSGIALTLCFGWELVGLSASLLVSRMVDFGARYLLFRRRFDAIWGRWPPVAVDRPDFIFLRERIRRFCKQAVALQVLDLVIWDRSEILFLKHFSPIQQVAFYSLSFNISQNLLVGPRVFASAAGASMMVRAGADAASAARMSVTALRLMSLVALPTTFVVAALSGPLMSLLYGDHYLEAIPVLALLAFFCSAKTFVLPVQQLLVAIDRQDVLVKVMAVSAVVNLILDLLLIPWRGAMGAAIANGAAQVLGAVWMWSAAAKVIPLDMKAINLPKLVGAALMAASPAFALARLTSPVAALLLGTPLAIATYLLVIRTLRGVPEEDQRRLLTLERRVPEFLRGIYRRSLGFVVP